jgi:hypothetical protein
MIRRAFIVLAGALLLLPAAGARALAEGRTHSYLILPFEDAAGDPSRSWMREAMSISLGEYFLCAGEKVVPRDDRLMAMEELSLPAGIPLTLATSIKLGRHFATASEGPRADRLVAGRFTLDKGQITLSARVLELDSNRSGPWKEEAGSLKDLLKLQRALTHSLLRRDSISGGDLAAAADDTGSGHAFALVAYENYVRGLIDPNPARQQSLLRKALDQSPGYPKACYQLGRILARGGKGSEAEGVLRKASAEPVPFAAEYHALLGILAMNAGRLSDAESEAVKSLSVRDTVEVRMLKARIARANNDPDGARAELDKAVALDPEHTDIETLRKELDKPPLPPR